MDVDPNICAEDIHLYFLARPFPEFVYLLTGQLVCIPVPRWWLRDYAYYRLVALHSAELVYEIVYMEVRAYRKVRCQCNRLQTRTLGMEYTIELELTHNITHEVPGLCPPFSVVVIAANLERSSNVSASSSPVTAEHSAYLSQRSS